MADLITQPLVLEGHGWADYALLDCGAGRKFERYGPYRFIRPEGQALWSPRLEQWDADGEFVPGSDEDGGGRWQFDRQAPRDGWPLAWGEGDDAVRYTAQCTPFRHLGFFPDMAPVWDWMGGQLAGRSDATTLNLCCHFMSAIDSGIQTNLAWSPVTYDVITTNAISFIDIDRINSVL